VTQGVGPYGTDNYTYDAMGNRLTRSLVNGATTSTTYTYTSTKTQLASAATGATTLSYTYDANGARTAIKKGNQTQASYTYNNDARLATAGTATLKYNAFGERSVETVGTGSTHFIFGSDGALLSEHTTTGALTRNTIYLNGQPLALVDSTGTVSYVLNDQVGQPQKMLNGSGAVSWQRVAGIFGDTVSQPVGTTSANPMRFPGQWYDGTTGLHYNYFRDYEPTTGRYLETDPIGLEGGVNVYAYVGGNPVNRADPNGEFGNPVTGAIIGALSGYAIAKLTGDKCYGWRDGLRDAAIGAVTGGLGGRGLTAGLKLLSNGAKGHIGEGLSIAKNLARGSRLVRTQAEIPGQTTIADSLWKSISGATYYVESKFGTSTLTQAQRRAANTLGDSYHVEKWSYPFFEKVGATAGGAAGGSASELGNDLCGC
jgi:RHS repeat-associated protein